jgi:hypothetical protein
MEFGLADMRDVPGTAGGAVPARFGLAFMANGLERRQIHPYAVNDGFGIFTHNV